MRTTGRPGCSTYLPVLLLLKYIVFKKISIVRRSANASNIFFQEVRGSSKMKAAGRQFSQSATVTTTIALFLLDLGHVSLWGEVVASVWRNRAEDCVREEDLVSKKKGFSLFMLKWACDYRDEEGIFTARVELKNKQNTTLSPKSSSARFCATLLHACF